MSGTELANIASIDAGPGNDTVTGSAGNDVIVGGTGSDLLAGGLGNDLFLITGSDTGYDRFQGDEGFDLILGGAGNDEIRVNNFSGIYTVEKIDGGLGLNTLTGTQYNDTIDLSATELMNISSINTGLGNDTVTGSAGNDIITGGTGSDLLAGGAGDDEFLIDGNENGYDRFQGDGGTDSILGGAGDDVIRVNNFSGIYTVEKIDGGLGFNTLAGTQYNDIIDLSGTELVNIASIEMGLGNDTLIGSAGNDVILGDTGSDILAGELGDDLFLIIGNDTGYDRFEGDGGIDLILGGSGDDAIRVNNFSGVYTVEKIDGGQGNNTFAGTQYNDTIDLSGTELINIASIEAGLGNDTVTGSVGNDVIVGGAGSDLLAGGLGDDLFLIDGSDNGYDCFQGDAGIDLILGGAGDDVIRVNNFSGVYTVEKIDGGLGVNTLAGTQYNDTIDLTDTELVNIASIDAGLGNDTVTGSAGNDVIIGGAGSDILMGGSGNDTYRFGAGSGADLIHENDLTTGNTDVFAIAAGIDSSQLWFRHIGNNLEMSIIGTSDKATIKDWYLGQAYHIEQFTTADGKTLLDSQVETLVSAMSAFAPPTTGQITLPENYVVTLSPFFAANWL